MPTNELFLEALNIIRPHLKDKPPVHPEGSWSPGPLLVDLNRIIVNGVEWVKREDQRKILCEFRDHLDKAVTLYAGQHSNESLRRIFHHSGDLPKFTDTISIKGPMDAVTDMIAECDRILGESDPSLKRYPRQKIIKDTLKTWERYTGLPIPPLATIPSRRERNKPSEPYKLCRIVLTLIEGKNPGDFSDIYAKIAKTFQK